MKTKTYGAECCTGLETLRVVVLDHSAELVRLKEEVAGLRAEMTAQTAAIQRIEASALRTEASTKRNEQINAETTRCLESILELQREQIAWQKGRP
jgi:hypothetical protein